MGAPTLASGFNTAQPLCFVPTPLGELLFVNGLERGGRWNGLYPTADLLGITAPGTAPTANSTGTGNTEAGVYTLAYRYVERKLGELPADRYSNLSPLRDDTATAGQKYIWTGLVASTQSRVTFVELFRSQVGDSSVLYLVTRLGHNGTITSAADNGGTFRFTVPEGHNLATGATFTISGATGTGAAAVNATHTITGTTATTIDVSTVYTNDATGGTWVLEGYNADTAADATLSDDSAADYLALPITNDDNSLNAYRFVPPPTDRAVAILFQDRTWYGVPPIYSQGTVTATNGSTTVSSSGANLREEMAGRLIVMTGDARAYRISSINEGTGAITLTEKHSGDLTGVSYTIFSDPITWDEWYYSEIDEPESVSTTNVVRVQTNVRDRDRSVGAIPFGSAMLVLKERHIYELTFQRQPRIDVNVRPFAYRGACNHRCWDTFEGTAFLLDQMGCYAIDISGAWKPISMPIQNLWRDGVIDYAKSNTFFVEVDPNERAVKFYVQYVGDGADRPLRWLKYSLDDGLWATGGGVHEIGHACKIDIAGRFRMVEGSEHDQIYLTQEGWSDHITTAVRCTVVSGSSTTLVVTQSGVASNAWQHAPVAIVDGTGRRQIRKIASNAATSGTSVTITLDTALTTACAAGDSALVGAIECSVRTKTFSFRDGQAGEQQLQDRGYVVEWTPTTNAALLNVRTYYDHEADPQTFTRAIDRKQGYYAVEDTPELYVPLALSASDEGDSAGSVLVESAAVSQRRGHARRSFEFELLCFAGEERVSIDAFEVTGAK